MPDRKKDTAILIFIRDAKHEAEEKTFVKHIGFQGNQKLAKKLNQRIISLSKCSGIPSFIFNSSKQIGYSFGERFSNAFKAIFSKGYKNIIAIGNDCLDLNSKKIQTAKDSLKHGDLVLGPTFDGGFYLIGISKKIFNPETFKHFNWTTDRLQNDFNSFILKHNIGTTFLEKSIDIDSESDLKAAIKKLPKLYQLRKAIEELLITFIFQIFTYRLVFINSNQLRFSSLRAPPSQHF